MRQRNLSRLLLCLVGFMCGILWCAGGASYSYAQAPATSSQDSLKRESFVYATRGDKKLYLDRIVDPSITVKGKRPVFIFSFGGGWEAGQRYDKSMDPFCKFVTSLGYIVVSIDYRLGIKEAKAKGELNEKNGVEMYLRAIDWAVEDLFDATAYILRNADAWNVDKKSIVIAGGSAGATNSIVAEYEVCNRTPLAQKYLPRDFNYAGVISMAGALWMKGENTPATWPNPPCPMLFFHGSKDQLVTYDEVHGAFTGYGPVYLHRQLSKMGCPNWFVDFPEADHVIAATPTFDNLDEIRMFLTKFVLGKQQSMIHTIQDDKVKKTVANMLAKYMEQAPKEPKKQ